jgi:peroxiredoxin
MTIKIGEKLPDASFMVMTAEGPAQKTAAEVFAGKKVALFAVPGAYTPTCQQQHVPGFVACVDELKGKGIDTIACTAVNDIFVLTQFAKDTGAQGKILMLADGNGEFAKKIGLDIDLSGFGLGLRSKRYAMLVDDGVVKILNVEDAPPQRQVERGDALLHDRPLALKPRAIASTFGGISGQLARFAERWIPGRPGFVGSGGPPT